MKRIFPLTEEDGAEINAPNNADRFSHWTLRGCGWTVGEYSVELEPPHVPFIVQRSRGQNVIDDGIKASLSSLIGKWVSKPFRSLKSISSDQFNLKGQAPKPFSPQEPPTELCCSIAIDTKIKREAAQELLLTIPDSTVPTSFEIIGTHDAIHVQFACLGNADRLKHHVKGYFPDVVIKESENHLSELWNKSPNNKSVVFELGLSEAFIKPIRVARSFDVDPLIATLSALENFGVGDLGVIQILFQPTKYSWKDDALKVLENSVGKTLKSDAPEALRNVFRKVSQSLFSVVLRIGVQARSEARMWQIARSICDSLRHLDNTTGNSFLPLDNEGYPNEKHENDLLSRATHRSGMILGSDELASLVHLPSSSVRSLRLVRETRKTKAAPRIVIDNPLVLGKNYHEGSVQDVSLNDEQRTRHMHIIGASGTGKSHLILNLLIQDLLAGRGFAVLDPHGDLIDRLLPYVPESRLDDVILFDPADEQYPIGFNILQAHSTLEKQLLSSDLVAVFKRLSTSWGDQMTSVLGNSILAFLESEKGGTLADMRRFLVEKEFRREFLKTVIDHEVLYYWNKEYPLLSGRPQAPLLTRLDTFLRPKLIRHIVAQKKNKLDFGLIMNSGKILLAKLSQGAIGEENSYLLGSLLVSKFYQLALSRQELQEASRKPFYLYIDEFHHFITPTLSTILSGARKYRLGLTLAHQDMRQLQSRDTELQSAVLTNPYTRICFRVGDMDARSLESGFAFFEGKDLQNLGRGEALVRVERTDYDFNLETYPLPEIEENSDGHIQAVIERSRKNYGTTLTEVEELLRQARAPNEEDEKPIEQPKTATTKEEAHENVEPVEITEEAPKRPIITPPPKPKVAPLPAPKKKPKEKDQLGKGGQQHRYLQELIKRWGEHNGFRTTIERPIPGSRESIDVALETDETNIACEISVTSTAEYELGNVQKCLSAGYDTIILVSADDKKLCKAEKYIKAKLDKTHLPKVKFFSPEDLFAFLGSLPNSRTEEVVGGYKVKVRVKPGSKEDAATRKKAISDVILSAMRRMKDK